MDVHPSGDHLIVGGYDRKLCWFDLELSDKPYRILRYVVSLPVVDWTDFCLIDLSLVIIREPFGHSTSTRVIHSSPLRQTMARYKFSTRESSTT